MNKIYPMLKILECIDADNGKILRPSLYEELENRDATIDRKYFGGVNWNSVYNFAKDGIEVINEVKDDVEMTELGRDVFSRKLRGTPDELRNFIFEKCLFENEKYDVVVNFLEKFQLLDKELILYEDEIDENENDHKDILTELKIIYFENDHWKMNDDIKNLVNLNRGHSKKTKKTQGQRDRENAEKVEVGNCAEELSEKYEKIKKWRSGMVDRVSINDDGKGYDIASIWKPGTKKHDKFIEVKGRKFNENSFIITDHELELAAKKGNRYVIYFWKNVVNHLEDAAIAKFKKPYKRLNDEEKKTLDCKTCDSAEPDKIIRDPIKTLKIKRCKNCIKYEIEL